MSAVATAELTSRPEVVALVSRGEERGCVNLSEFNELVQALELLDADVDALESYLEGQGIELTDDCGREGVELTTFRTVSWRPRPRTPSSSSSTRSAAIPC